MNYQLVIFDMDGTVLNTLEDLKDSVNHMMKVYGFPEHTLDEIRTYVGNGMEHLLHCAVPEGTSEEVLYRLLPEYRNYYQAHCRIKTRPYEGIPELMRDLREAGITVAVVSNKGDGAVGKLCEDFFPGLVDLSMGENEQLRRKPWPDMVFYALNKLGLPASEALYVGDSDVDYHTAEHADMDCALVSWGFRGHDFIAAYDSRYHVDTVEELRQIFFGK